MKHDSFKLPVEVSKIANLHYFEFISGYHTNENHHNFCELLYVDRGNITVESENFRGDLSDNQLIIHRPNEVHSLFCDEDTAPNVIIIGFECASTDLELLSRRTVTLNAEQKRQLAEVMQEGMSVFAPPYDLPDLEEMEKREDFPYGADQMLKLRLELFLISVIRECKSIHSSSRSIPSTTDSISNIRQYITEHYTEKILLENICFLFGTNKTTLCKKFKNEYGTTIFNYINNLKVKEAKALLRENKLSVTEISEKLGFNSIHYFCRLFKKTTGQSPKEYTKTIQSKLNL